MKKIIFILSLSSLVFSGCSKPNTDTHDSNTAPDQPMTQTTTPPSATTATATATGDSAETALDWAGEYKGVSPALTVKVLKPSWN